jgi:hypothetical protein
MLMLRLADGAQATTAEMQTRRSTIFSIVLVISTLGKQKFRILEIGGTKGKDISVDF